MRPLCYLSTAFRRLPARILLPVTHRTGMDSCDDIGFNHLPLDQRGHLLEAVQKLTLDQLKVVLKKHLALDRLVQVGVGPTVAQEPLPSPGGE